MKAHLHLLVWFGCVFVSGCASEVGVHELPSSIKPGDAVDGIPFRVQKRFDAVIYEKTDAGYKEVKTLPVTIPDPNRLYVINFNAQFFANPTFDLQLNPDNTLSQVSLKSKSSAAAALKEAGTQINAVAKAKSDAAKDATTAATATADLQIALSSAKSDARIAEAEYDLVKNKSDATTLDLLKAEKKVRETQLTANKAAQLAGKPLPYPDALP